MKNALILYRLCHSIVKLFSRREQLSSLRKVLHSRSPTLTRGTGLARACRRYACTGCRFSKDEPGGCTTFTTSTSSRRVRSIEQRRESSRRDAMRRNPTQRNATRFHGADGNRFVTLSRCNYTSGECARACARASTCPTNGSSQHAANERTHAHAHAHADASTVDRHASTRL